MSNTVKVLLDTHIWVRLQTLSRPVSREAIRAIQKAERIGSVYISAISVWEVAMITRKNRLALDMPIRQWVTEALNKPGIQLLPVTAEIAIEASELPEPMHKDPSDRLIVASARTELMTLITADKLILQSAPAIGLNCIEG